MVAFAGGQARPAAGPAEIGELPQSLAGRRDVSKLPHVEPESDLVRGRDDSQRDRAQSWYSQNGDGLDLEHCRNVIVRGSRFDVGDDAICLKSGANERGRRIGVPTENVLVEDCIVYHGHGGFTIGSEMSSGVRNVRVNNCVFMGTDVGLRFKSTRGRGGVVEKIYISNVRMTDIPTEAIGFNMYYGGQAPLDAKGELTMTDRKEVPVSEETPQFRDIYIENVICRGAQTAVLLQGLPEMPIRGIHLRNVSITAQTGMAWMDADNITCKNVEILNGKGPVLNLFDVKNSVVDHLTYPADAETVVKAQGDGNSGIVIKNTNLKAAAKDFILTGGASRQRVQSGIAARQAFIVFGRATLCTVASALADARCGRHRRSTLANGASTCTLDRQTLFENVFSSAMIRLVVMSSEQDILDHLAFLYGPEIGHAVAKQLAALLEGFRKRNPQLAENVKAPADRLTERDAFLITYGDQITEPDRPPLQTLAQFPERAFGRYDWRRPSAPVFSVFVG